MVVKSVSTNSLLLWPQNCISLSLSLSLSLSPLFFSERLFEELICKSIAAPQYHVATLPPTKAPFALIYRSIRAILPRLNYFRQEELSECRFIALSTLFLVTRGEDRKASDLAAKKLQSVETGRERRRFNLPVVL